ncbi:hypothetical protein N7451_005472 [Penicillium sp. IBT 35674x]|nr:hypothetical protein N7451_005472 [Penicillium sp. IBT 35674x]
MSNPIDTSGIRARNPSGIFHEASILFLNSLSDKDRTDFQIYSNPEAMNTDIRQHIENINDKARRNRLELCADRCRNLAQRMEPYFGVVDTFVSVKPEYLGIVWGAIKLVFTLSTNYIEYMERISEMFDEISVFLKVYEQYLDRFRERLQKEPGRFPTRLQKTLADVYVDVIAFCHQALGLFSSKTRFSLRLKLSILGRTAWRPFDLEFKDVKSRLANHRELFEFEARSAVDYEALRFYEKFDKYLEMAIYRNDRQKREGDRDFARHQEDETNKLLSASVERIGHWISPPQWKARYEEMTNSRDPGTAEWILQDPIYLSWRSQTETDQSVLFINANPGFGKSTLCPVIIDDLRRFQEAYPDLPFTTVAYFFFNKQMQHQRNDFAFRSILVQMLHTYRHDTRVIDIIGTMCHKKVAGQPFASDQEVFAALQLLLEQFPRAAFVVDAIDECVDPLAFLNTLEELNLHSRNCFLVLFSRPTVLLPRAIQERSKFLSLEQRSNTDDLERFLQPRLNRLVRNGLIPSPICLEDYIEPILFRANGLFLWTKLLVTFLESRCLTMDQRLDALQNLNRLEGLDCIYRGISETLRSANINSATTNIEAAFRWILGANRPVTVDELAVAMVHPSDGPLTTRDVVHNLRDSIGHIFGGLLEVIKGQFVQFIHVSANEFFTSATEVRLSARQTQLQFTPAEIELGVSLTVMSYLVHTVPARPLSGDMSSKADAENEKRRFPLLDYCALFWPSHINNALLKSETVQADLALCKQGQQLINLLLQFIYNGDRLCVWLEASWLFGRPPSMCPLPEQNLLAMSKDGMAVRQVADDYLLLCNELETLEHSWGYILENEPQELWRRTGQSRLIHLTSSEINLNRSILLASHTSVDGTQSASLRLIPPASLPTLATAPPFPIEAMDWTVHYDIWSLDSGNHLLTIAWIVDPTALKPVLQWATDNLPDMRANTRFMFPVAFSQDLRQVVALNSVVRIKGSLDSKPQAYHITLDVFNRLRPYHSAILDTSLQIKSWTTESKYLVVLFQRPQTFLWDFTFALEHGAPIRIPTRDLYRPWNGVVESIAFSADGQFMYGKSPGSGYPVVLSIEECMKSTTGGSTRRALPSGRSGHQQLAKRDENQWIITPDKENLERLFEGLSTAPTQAVGALSFSRNGEGQPQISQVQNWKEEGTIVLKSLTVDGRVEYSSLSRLPDDLRFSSKATMLRTRPDEDSNIVRMCLDKAEQNLYSLHDCGNMANVQLPAIVERCSSTIQSRTYMARRALDDMHTEASASIGGTSGDPMHMRNYQS